MSGASMQRVISCNRSSWPSQVLKWRNSVGRGRVLPMRMLMPSIPCLSQYIRVMPSPHILLRP